MSDTGKRSKRAALVQMIDLKLAFRTLDLAVLSDFAIVIRCLLCLSLATWSIRHGFKYPEP